MGKKQMAIAVIGGGIVVLGSGIAITYILQRRKEMIEQETLKKLEKSQPRDISKSRFVRPTYSLKEIQPIPQGVPPRGGFKNVPQDIVPRGGFNNNYERPNYALLRLRERRQRTIPLRVLRLHEYENSIEKEELRKKKRKQRIANFNIIRSPFK